MVIGDRQTTQTLSTDDVDLMEPALPSLTRATGMDPLT